MSKHPPRWESLAFGVFFLAVVACWAVWSEDLLTPRQLSLTASGALIVLGVIGVGATLRPARRTPVTPAVPTTDDPEGHDHGQAADPQP